MRMNRYFSPESQITRAKAAHDAQYIRAMLAWFLAAPLSPTSTLLTDKV